MYPSMRLSRIHNPRATVWSIVLLVAALGMFGAWASQSARGSTAPVEYANEQPQAAPELPASDPLAVG